MSRLIETPTRKRPFNSLSPTDQKKSFEELRREKKKIERRYDKLVDRFEDKCISLNLSQDSVPKMQVQTACVYLKEKWNESKNIY